MACSVARSHRGYLALRVYFDGHETWEGLGWRDTEVNRQLAQRLAEQISIEIRSKTFTAARYRRYFPNGNYVDKLERPSGIITADIPTLDAFFAEWITRPVARPSRGRDRRQHLTRYVLSATVTHAGGPRRLGTLSLTDLRPAHLRELQRKLLAGGFKLKTVRNVIDSSFRAMVRDARKDDLVDKDPFAALDWPRVAVHHKPDPFSEAERDRLLQWFRKTRRRYYAFIVTLFETGMRPSEAVGLKWGDIDTRPRHDHHQP